MMYLLKDFVDFDNLPADQQVAVIAYFTSDYYSTYATGEVEPITDLIEDLKRNLFKVTKVKRKSLKTEKMTWYYNIEWIGKEDTIAVNTN